jgi:hypothetical protein
MGYNYFNRKPDAEKQAADVGSKGRAQPSSREASRSRDVNKRSKEASSRGSKEASASRGSRETTSRNKDGSTSKSNENKRSSNEKGLSVYEAFIAICVTVYYYNSLTQSC